MAHNPPTTNWSLASLRDLPSLHEKHLAEEEHSRRDVSDPFWGIVQNHMQAEMTPSDQGTPGQSQGSEDSEMDSDRRRKVPEALWTGARPAEGSNHPGRLDAHGLVGLDSHLCA